MATPKRRSARLSGRGNSQRSVKSIPLESPALLADLIEREETPDNRDQLAIDIVLSTPGTNGPVQSRLAELTNIKTPKSEPKPAHQQMHPHTVHQSTAKVPDSGMKLGFGNPPATGGRQSIALMQNTPSKVPGTPKDAKSGVNSTYEFKFHSASHLSSEAQQLMSNLRDEAARIKEQMRAEKMSQEEKDAKADNQFPGFGFTARKIATPKGRAGRFSDVHMAAFKKMDSIANHVSAFRANNTPGFTQHTAQSLKRSPSKAGLDELAPPQTADKGTRRERPSRRTASISPFKRLPEIPQDASTSTPAKRQRQSECVDVASARTQIRDQKEKSKSSTLPRPVPNSNVSHSLQSPTKSSLARSTSTKLPIPKTDERSTLPQPQSTNSLQPTNPSKGSSSEHAVVEEFRAHQVSPIKVVPASISTILQPDSATLSRPLPPLPRTQIPSCSKSAVFSLQRSESTKSSASPTKARSVGSRLPTFAGLKSILRSSRPRALQAPASPSRPGTPKRPNTATATDSVKKVDFTPSVKSRYAVKLAAESPSPSKIHQDTPRPPRATPALVAYTMSDEEMDEGEWEDAEIESEVVYPTLPPSSPVQKQSPHDQSSQAFLQKRSTASRRESLDFKMISANSLRDVNDYSFSNDTTNKADIEFNTNKVTRSPGSASKSSSSTIRRVRPSAAHEVVKPFEEPEKYLAHGLPAKKRRHEMEEDEASGDTKENQRPSQSPAKVPGGWEDSVCEEDDGDKRGGKRIRLEEPGERAIVSPRKKAISGREAAGNAAKERKKKGGILSMSRLNMLARPKGH